MPHTYILKRHGCQLNTCTVHGGHKNNEGEGTYTQTQTVSTRKEVINGRLLNQSYRQTHRGGRIEERRGGGGGGGRVSVQCTFVPASTHTQSALEILNWYTKEVIKGHVYNLSY